MNLPFFKKSTKIIAEFLFTLIYSDAAVTAVLWKSDPVCTIIAHSKVQIFQNEAEVAAKTDLALQDLGKQSESVDQVIFGVPDNWLEGDELMVEKKVLLKTITEKLGLKAIGFVSVSEAIVKQLCVEDPRCSTLLINFSRNFLYVSLIYQGQLLSTKFVGRSGQTLADLTEALARLITHLELDIKLPSKMLLTAYDLDQASIKEQQQILLDHDWVNTHPFVHQPIIEVIDPKTVLSALIAQTAQSIGVNQVAKITNKVKSTVMTSNENNLTQTLSPAQDKPLPTSFGIPVKMDQLSKAENNHEDSELVAIEKKDKANTKLIITMIINMKNWFADHKIFAVGGFIAGILTLLGLSSYGINHFVTATLELTLATKTIAKETQISLDSTAAVSDPEKLILSAKQVEKQVMGSKSTDATGIKLVGDKANGAVTLYNKTQATKTFEQGTKISKGNLVFTLNETVEVASSSVEKTTNGEKIEYGKVEAQITASAIGAEYNLAMDAELQIEAYAIETFSATVTKALIGGSSREIRMVALEDRQKLLTDLTAQLVKQANEEFSHEYQDGTSIVPTNQVIVVKNDFDAQIGDEVSIFKLDLELKIKALSYQNIDLGPLAAKVLQDNVPAGYVLDTSKPEILSAPNKNETGDQAVKLAVNLAAQAKPILNIDELKSQIKGKKITEAVNILSSNAAIKEIKITLLPPLVAKFWPILPKDPAKIEIL